MNRADKHLAAITRYVEALKAIAALPKTHDGAVEEEEWNDMEDAFGNGVDVGLFDGYQRASALAKEALKG